MEVLSLSLDNLQKTVSEETSQHEPVLSHISGGVAGFLGVGLGLSTWITRCITELLTHCNWASW
jgi:hypothetical protein